MQNQKQNIIARIYKFRLREAIQLPAPIPYSTFNIQHSTSRSRGFTLIETIIYISAFAVLSMVAMQATIIIMKSFYTLRINQSVNVSATVALERMSREIRNAYDIDTMNTTFSTNPGRLTLMTKDTLGANTTVEFYVTGSKLNMKVGGIDNGSLLTKTVTLPSLIFRPIITNNSKAVKVEMILNDSRATSTQNTNFYDTIILRGSVH